MKILGITGGVGAGKSTVLAYLQERYGAYILQLDIVAHELMKKGGGAYAPIIEAFGRDILDKTGEIVRPRLSEKIFEYGGDIRRLNAIVHPLVKEEVLKRLQEQEEKSSAPFAVLEAALLLEDHYDKICDEIWYIYVNETVRRQRLRDTRGYTEEKTDSILKQQKSDEEFRRLCQFVVDNSSSFIENTYEQIDKGLKEHGFV